VYDFKAPFLGTGSRSYSKCDCIVYYITYIDLGIEATTCAHSAYTIRYDKRGTAPQFSVHVYCDQSTGWTKTPLGTEVDLGPGHIMLDGDPAPK